MTSALCIVGFGGEISHDLPLTPAVAQALDVEVGRLFWLRPILSARVTARHTGW